MYGYLPEDWLETQHAQPPTYTADAIKARGSGADGAMEEVRRQWSEKLGKPLVWRLDGETWRLVDGPSTPTGRVVRKTF